MKVLLINPGRSDYSGNLNAVAAAPPLGLMYVASNLVKNGHEVKLIDQNGTNVNDDEIVSKAKKWCPDLAGFSVMGYTSLVAGKITEKLKKALPNLKVLWGGISPTFNAGRILSKYNGVDFCLRGEGEESIIELIKSLKSKAYNKVHGLVYKTKSAIKEGLPKALIRNLDSLPFPDRELIKDVQYGSISGLRLNGFTTLLSSRGCPHECKYCCCNALTNRVWRARSVSNVLDELELIESQGYKYVLFADDGLTLNDNRLIKLSEGMRERKINLNWFSEGRVDNARVEVFKSMVKSGARICYFGAESASKRVLDIYNKGITPEQTQSAVSKARKAGMDFIVCSFILGAPGETKAEVDSTIDFMTKLDIDFVQVTNLIAYPGTALWDELVAKKYLNPDDYWETGVDVSEVHPDSLPTDYLKTKVKESYRRFVASPRVKARHIYRLFKSRFRQKVFFSNFKYFDKDLVKRLVGR